ncbi:Glutathione gamma-glutamylcysteinyltransferase 1 [Stylosanthes scabra]|uniref:Glutathione gamma-glutamylcysteinyltransferase 1 n=1 Tax=Stylosanthes scabra TaxID=79078 RepID=A0ABU6Q5C7_9FABA|nr:Glutathione gamma-glutamylcysteinyltransferase 1 [Stylosanthes scabra]
MIPSRFLPRPPNKLFFHHNVSLTVSVAVGTPLQNVTMVIDIGSELSWLHCTTRNTTTNMVIPDPLFNPTLSSSFTPIPCSSPTCTTRTRDFPIPASCDSNNHCHATLSYVDASSSEGDLAFENFRFGSGYIRGIVFGCMNSSFSSNVKGDSNTTGLLGMNLGSLSLVSQLKLPKFSYCISGYDFSSVLVLGESNISWVGPFNYTSLVQEQDRLPYFDRVAYTVQLKGIKVGNNLLNISDTVLVQTMWSGQTMFDLGTQFTFLLDPAYSALREEFINQTNSTLRVLDDPNFVFQMAIDLCYLIPTNQSLKLLQNLPSVSLVFDGAEFIVRDEQLLYKVSGLRRGNDSVYCFTFGNSDLLGVEAFIIGHHQKQNMLVEFDLVEYKVGWAKKETQPHRSWFSGTTAVVEVGEAESTAAYFFFL